MLLNKRYIPPPETRAKSQVCQDLNLREPRIKGMLGIPLNLLRISSQHGCCWCGLLEAALNLPDLEPPAGQSLFGVTLFAGDNFEEEDESLPLIMRLQTEYWHYAEVEIFTEQGIAGHHYPCPAPVIRPARIISQDASSTKCISLMKSWISYCLLHHRKCSSTGASVLPDRVLDVEKGQIPRLCITRPKDRGTYAALSHRWGGNVALRLTDGNLDDLKNGVAWDSLPKTFQDAIEMCRLLDIRYLWIDSLCIIQTSRLDWDEQGSKMHTVYSRAFLVIATDGAANSEEDFLRHPKRNHPSLKLPFCPDKSFNNSSGSGVDGRQSIYARRKGVGGRDVFFHHSRRGEYRSNLSLRGWVLQESILAQRILHFTAEEVTWECNETSWCECQIAPHTLPNEAMIPLKHRLRSALSHTLDWPNLVQDFSCRNLTYNTDRLAAMSGLAASIQPRNPAIVYYAGLWSDSLPQSLYWYCLPHGPDLPASPRISQRTIPPCAPTWSWASITGRVAYTFEVTPGHIPFQDIKVSCRPSGKNKYGAVSGATITARACVLQGKVFRDPASTGENQFQIQFWSQSGMLPPVGGTFLDVVGGGSTEIEGGDDVILAAHSLQVFLMLKLESSSDSGTYRRVGLLICGHFPQDCCPPVWQTITIV